MFAEVVPAATEFRFEYARSVGLTEFEVPEDNLALLTSVLKEYESALAAANLQDPGLLATVNAPPFGTIAAMVAPAEETYQVAPLDFEKQGYTGAYSSVLAELARRAGQLADEAGTDGDGKTLATLLRAAGDRLGRRHLSGSKLPISIEELAVRFNRNEAGAVVFDAAGKEKPVQLPALARLGEIELSSIPSLEKQVEDALEQVNFDKKIDVLVSADVQRIASDKSEILFRIGYVGPLGAPAVPVSDFTLSFVTSDYKPFDQVTSGDSGLKVTLPDAKSVLDETFVTLYRVHDESVAGGAGYLTDWAPGAATTDEVTFSLGAVPQGQSLSISAIQRVMESVLGTLKNPKTYDLMGVFVDAAPNQLDMKSGGKDLRPETGTSKTFALTVIPGVVGSVRAIASGDRVDPSERVNPPYRRFDRIRDRSPFQPSDPSTQLLRNQPLQDYLDRASRHPNRRVDAAVTALAVPDLPKAAVSGDAGASTGEGTSGGPDQGASAPQPMASPAFPATVGIDYLVTEVKPWSVFAQVSNTGTQSTGEWQERFGFFHSDLFGNDEILSIEYVTTNFEDTHGINAYFDAPLGESDWIRWKIFGGWNGYTASDVGNSQAQFEGESPFAAGELALNLWQSGKFFFDVVGGVRWFDVYVNNIDVAQEGRQDFLVPYVGARLQRNARDKTTDFGVFADFSLADVTDVDLAEQQALGRLDPDRDWQLLRWDLYQSFYLDPIFQHDERNIETATLGHEIAFRFRGQYSFGNRLIPQQMGVAGGLYTVRGYPESIVAGDDVMIFTSEYRMHIPQLLGIDRSPEPFLGMGEPFRLRPQFGYGATDWDLIFRAFVDIGRSENSDRKSYEFDETLVGAGIGLQLQVLRNLDLRLDLGFPLQDLESRPDIDSSRLTFVGTLAF